MGSKLLFSFDFCSNLGTIQTTQRSVRLFLLRFQFERPQLLCLTNNRSQNPHSVGDFKRSDQSEWVTKACTLDFVGKSMHYATLNSSSTLLEPYFNRISRGISLLEPIQQCSTLIATYCPKSMTFYPTYLSAPRSV